MHRHPGRSARADRGVSLRRPQRTHQDLAEHLANGDIRIVHIRLRIQVAQPELRVLIAPVVDDPQAAALAPATVRIGVAQLAQPAGALDQHPGLGQFQHQALQRAEFVVVHEFLAMARELGQFDKQGIHGNARKSRPGID